MALLPHCDKCGAQGQVVQILGKDLCAARCIPRLQTWLNIKHKTSRLRANQRFEYARKLIAANGYVDARTMSEATGERHETAHEALRWMDENGTLRRISRGKYALPVQEAAE